MLAAIVRFSVRHAGLVLGLAVALSRRSGTIMQAPGAHIAVMLVVLAMLMVIAWATIGRRLLFVVMLAFSVCILFEAMFSFLRQHLMIFATNRIDARLVSRIHGGAAGHLEPRGRVAEDGPTHEHARGRDDGAQRRGRRGGDRGHRPRQAVDRGAIEISGPLSAPPPPCARSIRQSGPFQQFEKDSAPL